MASVKLEHIYKVYPNGTKAVSDFTMDIKDGEFIVFVGPSGCGKSTTLRMIAGLEDITTGELYIDNHIVNSVEPKDRDIAMVFQNYALYPHMTIYENMAFGLKIRHEKNEIIHQKVLWAADILGITDYLDRKPKAMSGGQRQRVALGRAILRDPKVMLLDEPLSNLDAKLRTQMRSEIAKLHQQLKTTFIYVTHDQTEAMTLGNRVVVMKDGYVQQIDTPKKLYNYPCNKFVAGFIGSPQMNFFQGNLFREKDKVRVDFSYSDAKISVPYEDMLKVRPSYLDGKHQVYIGIRYENISLATKNDKSNIVKVKVSHFEELGAESLVYGDINMNGDGFEETATRVIMKVSDIGEIKIGDVIDAKFDMSKAHFFDKQTEETILPRIPVENAFDCEIQNNTVFFLDYKVELPKAITLTDQKSAVFMVPSEAIIISDEGALEAKVVKMEIIEDKKICYLTREGRTFFAITDREYEADSTVKFNIDFTLVEVEKTENGQDSKVLTALGSRDLFTAKFFNYSTLMAVHPDERFLKHHDERLALNRQKLNDERHELEQKVAEEKNMYTPEYTKKKLEEAEKNYQTLMTEINPRLEKIKAESKEKLAAVKAEHKELIKKIKVQVTKEYDQKKKIENTNYRAFLRENKDKLVIKRRREEHRIFNETTPAQKERDLTNLLNNEGTRFDGECSQVKSRLRREITEGRTAIKAAQKDIKFYHNPVKYIDSKYIKQYKLLSDKEKLATRQAEMIFFFSIKNYFFESTEVISNKLIQGLGTSVFNKSFLVEVPHNAYEISDEGVLVTVETMLDYKNENYIDCVYADDSGEKVHVYVAAHKNYAPGTVIHIKPDITASIITEPAMNIRLY